MFCPVAFAGRDSGLSVRLLSCDKVTFMSNQTIKAVLLDYGGVIAEEGFRNGLHDLAREQGIDPVMMHNLATVVVYETGFVLGWGSEATFWSAMREETGLEGSDAVLTRRILDGFTLRPWVIEHVRRWRAQGVITGILSDQSHWLDELDARDHFFAEFDHVFNSYHLGKGKRDTTLFNDIAKQLGLEPAGILFIDDLRANIERALAAGWQAVFSNDKTSFEAGIKQYM